MENDQHPVAIPLLGAHMSIAGGYERAVHAARDHRCSAVQLFTKNNNQWGGKPITDGEVQRFREALDAASISATVAHDSYLINLGSANDTLWNRSIEALAEEVRRADLLGIVDLVIHPGAHVGSGEEVGLARIALGLDHVTRATPDARVVIDLESTAGQGSNLGKSFTELKGILDRVESPDRFGVCLDSCHLFAAGYPIHTEEGYNSTIDELDRLVGAGRVRVWHLNDSERDFGSRVDRHAGIGRGKIGVDAFARILNDPRFRRLPFILETPKGDEDGRTLDEINLELLRSLWRADADGPAAKPSPRATTKRKPKSRRRQGDD